MSVMPAARLAVLLFFKRITGRQTNESGRYIDHWVSPPGERAPSYASSYTKVKLLLAQKFFRKMPM
jgi:hypothetical protein